MPEGEAAEEEAQHGRPSVGARRSGAEAAPSLSESERTVETGDVQAGLAQIAIADPAFDEATFLAGANRAFEMIVGAFAAGDTGQLRLLLSNDVYEEFAAAIRERAARSAVMETTVVSIVSREIIEAEMRGRVARITVKFLSEQINFVRDAEGHVIEGDPGRVVRVTDIWCFERNTGSRDPNWKLAATRSLN